MNCHPHELALNRGSWNIIGMLECAFPCGQIHMNTPSGYKDAIPAWIKFAVQAPGEIPYNGIYYDPPAEVSERGIRMCLGKM